MAGQPSIFARIIAGEIPCHKVYETAHVLAFLDVRPLADGHTLVLPKRTVARFEDLTADEAAELGRALHAVARKVLAATGAPAYNILQNNGPAASQEVPHVHFHIVPRHAGDGLGFRWRPQEREPQALAELAARISTAP
jgi:histidine triad (HIT) family protein